MRDFYYFEPGDLLLCERESFDFHKGERYPVSKVYRDGDEDIIVMMKDKNGIDRYKRFYHWEEFSNKISDNTLHRWFEARLKRAWDNNLTLSSDSSKIAKSITTYEINSNGTVFDGDLYPGTAKVKFNNLAGLIEARPFVFFKTYDDYVKYFKKLLPKDFDVHDLNAHYTTGEMYSKKDNKADYLVWLETKNYPEFPGTDAEYKEVTKQWGGSQNTVRDSPWGNICKLPFPEYCDYMAQRTFDVPKMTDPKQKELVRDIATVFSLLPPSYGVTSVAKCLAGQGKADKLTKVKDYFGKYNKYLKTPQMWDLVDNIDSYMHENDVFMTKDAYDTWAKAGKPDDQRPPDWIGAKAIDRVKLEAIIKSIE